MRFLPSCGCINTTVWMYHMDIIKTHGHKTRWELYKNAICCFEQILETTLHKIATGWPLTSHLKNHPSKTNRICGALLEEQIWTHKQCSSMDPYTWMCQYWPTSKNLHQLCMDTRCSLKDLLGVMDDKDRQKESLGNPCYQCDWVMIFCQRKMLFISFNNLYNLCRTANMKLFDWFCKFTQE